MEQLYYSLSQQRLRTKYSSLAAGLAGGSTAAEIARILEEPPTRWVAASTDGDAEDDVLQDGKDLQAPDGHPLAWDCEAALAVVDSFIPEMPAAVGVMTTIATLGIAQDEEVFRLSLLTSPL